MHALREKTDSIHLAPEGVDDYADGLIAWNGVVGVADVKLNCHGDLAFVAREVPAVEGNIRGLHGWCFVVGCLVGFAVGFATRFVVGMFWHDQMSTGGYGFLYENKVSRRGRRCACRQLLMALRRRKWCPDVWVTVTPRELHLR